jgi:hypothetical protein
MPLNQHHGSWSFRGMRQNNSNCLVFCDTSCAPEENTLRCLWPCARLQFATIVSIYKHRSQRGHMPPVCHTPIFSVPIWLFLVIIYIVITMVFYGWLIVQKGMTRLHRDLIDIFAITGVSPFFIAIPIFCEYDYIKWTKDNKQSHKVWPLILRPFILYFIIISFIYWC